MQILTGKTMNGAMTFILIHLVKTFGNLTYGRLLEYMHDTVQRANKQGCFSCSFLRKVLRYKQIQVISLLPYSFPYLSFYSFLEKVTMDI